MIPKKIHYCWFGRNPKPKLALKCIAGWKKHCPDYQIIEWNEDNFDISACPLYVRQAYEAKRWAFVTDYVRLKVVYDHGGIYLDTDVELIKKPDQLLVYEAYFGFEDGRHVNTGLGFGAVKGAPILMEMMQDYDEIPFVLKDGTYDLMPCPVRNTMVFEKRGFQLNNSWQLLENNLILPFCVMNPLNLNDRALRITFDTISIHWFSGSWMDEKEKKSQRRVLWRIRREFYKDRLIRFLHRLLRKVLGKQGYVKLRNIVRKKSDR